VRTITIVLRGEDFSAEMAKMRAWLDQHMFRPSKFIYKQDREIITISIDFLSNHHAEAFKRHFDGHESEAHFSLPNGLDPLGRTSGEGRTTEIPGTMAPGLLVASIGGRDSNRGRQIRLGVGQGEHGVGRSRLGATGRTAGASSGGKRQSPAGLFRITLATNCSAQPTETCAPSANPSRAAPLDQSTTARLDYGRQARLPPPG